MSKLFPSPFRYACVGVMSYAVWLKDTTEYEDGEIYLGHVWNGGSKYGWCWQDEVDRRRHDEGYPSRESAARALRGRTEERAMEQEQNFKKHYHFVALQRGLGETLELGTRVEYVDEQKPTVSGFSGHCDFFDKDQQTNVQMFVRGLEEGGYEYDAAQQDSVPAHWNAVTTARRAQAQTEEEAAYDDQAERLANGERR